MIKVNMNLEKFRDVKGKCKSLYTIVVRNMKKEEFMEELVHKMNVLKNVRDTYKKNKRSEILYSFMKYIEVKQFKSGYNHVFLVGKDIGVIKLTKKVLHILNNFQVPKLIFKNENYFEIDYLNDLFYDVNVKDVLHVRNDNLNHYQLNSTKKKLVTTVNLKNTKLTEYLSNIPEKCLIHGVSVHLKNLKVEHFVFSKYLHNTEILDVFLKEEEMKKHCELEDCFRMLDREDQMEKVVYGDKIVEAITNYMMGKVFCTEKMAKKLNEKMEDYINFPIVIVKSLKKNDIADKLDRDYRGIIGVKYY